MKKREHGIEPTGLALARLIVVLILCPFINPVLVYNPRFYASGIGLLPFFIIFGFISAAPVVIFMHAKQYTQYWQWIIAGLVAGTIAGLYSGFLLINNISTLWGYSVSAALLYCFGWRYDQKRQL